MPRKCPHGLNGTCSFCGWRLRSLSWEPGNEDGVPKVSTTAHVTEGALTLQAPRPRLSSLRKPLLATTKLPERTPLSESQSVSKALPWCSPSLGWPSLLSYSPSCNCTSLCLKKPTTRKSGRLQEHSRYEMMQRSWEWWGACSVNIRGNTGQMVPVLIFPGAQTLCL